MPRQRRRLRVELAGAPSFTFDISPGGFCAESMRVLPPGTDVRGKIRVLDGGEVEFTGKVAWTLASEPRLQLRGKMGIQFTGVGSHYYGLF